MRWQYEKYQLSKFHEVVRSIAAPHAATFVVAGAHSFGLDGELNDLEHVTRLAQKHDWAAVLLIEASPLLAARLEARIRARSPFRSRVIVSNAAVCPTRMLGRTLPFYTVAAKLMTGDARLPDFVDQAGSFDRDRVSRLAADTSKYMRTKYGAANNWTADAVRRTIVESAVPCRSIEDELRQRALPPPAVLVIDIEGLDCEVASELPCAIAPAVLQFETTWCPKEAEAQAHRRVPARTSCTGEPLGYGNATRPKWSDVAFLRRFSS